MTLAALAAPAVVVIVADAAQIVVTAADAVLFANLSQQHMVTNAAVLIQDQTNLVIKNLVTAKNANAEFNQNQHFL